MTSVQPVIRGLQKVREAAGIYQSKDTKLVDMFQAAEAAGTRPITTPMGIWYYLGTKTVNPV